MDEKKIAFIPKMYFPERVLVGNSLSLLTNQENKKILVICSSFIWNFLKEKLEETFGEKTIFEIQKGEPGKSDIDRIKERALEERIESIVAIGGGSVIDTAKIVKNNLKTELIAIPTTLGSGTEVSQHAIYTEDDVKKISSSRFLLPETVILDSEYLTSVPFEKSKHHLIDALAHSLESLVSKFSNSLSDNFSLSALKTIFENYAALKNPEKDKKALGSLQIAGVMAGLAQSSAGTGLAHALAHYYGVKNDIPHAKAVSIFLKDVVRTNFPKTDKYQKINSLKNLSSENLLPALEELYSELDIDTPKITVEDFDADAQAIRKDINTLTNPYLPSLDEIKKIIEKHV